ncbi:hypothetical protein BZL35_00121 [Candidatus Pandoraea novymonadis]|uniref:Uncharacterized protein n=1 Tax=Candidatus Pandoraea novymonadis TaxID=1808959 RepID=A0ABX5FEL9_9BURK|nr:hypothetical protein BZL35_00029 [Candidatus Pandoraea novymonadis]PSB91903.1 hypothetical protein BZL35_00121 [Candidatus Pandoraea novymonadis]
MGLVTCFLWIEYAYWVGAEGNCIVLVKGDSTDGAGCVLLYFFVI